MEPDSQGHCVREDGVLATLTYHREQDVVGWSRHLLGGRFGSGAPVIESMASIPGSTATGSENRDEAWVAVKRTIDGATFRSIEVRSEEHTSALQSLMRISYAVFCLKKKKNKK